MPKLGIKAKSEEIRFLHTTLETLSKALELKQRLIIIDETWHTEDVERSLDHIQQHSEITKHGFPVAAVLIFHIQNSTTHAAVPELSPRIRSFRIDSFPSVLNIAIVYCNGESCRFPRKYYPKSSKLVLNLPSFIIRTGSRIVLCLYDIVMHETDFSSPFHNLY